MTEYFVKSMFCFSILYCCHIAFFRSSTNYQMNRIILLASVLFSLLVPAANISITSPQTQGNNNNQSVLNIVSYENYVPDPAAVMKVVQNSSIDLPSLLSIVYALVTLILLVRFSLNIYLLLLKGYRSEKVIHHGNTLALMNEDINPFTFLNVIFISRAYFRQGVEHELILHEIAHKKQWHSLDIIFMELTQVFFWFNPFVYLFKKLIKANHEYLADDFVLRSGISYSDYSNKLLNHTFKRKTIALASGFNYLLIKNRLIMSTKFNQKRGFLYQLGVFIPLITILFLSTAFNTTHETSPAKYSQKEGVFYADSLYWSAETKQIWLKGKLKVKFGNNDFTGDGGFSGFGQVNLLIVDNKKASPNTSLFISGKKCVVVTLTKEEAIKKYGQAGDAGAVEITTSR